MQRGQRAIAIGFFVSTLTLLGAALKPDGAVSSQTMPIQSASSTLPDQPFFFQPPGVQINPPGPAATSLPLAPSAGGTWTVVSSPNTSATEHNFLQNVTCMSASDCWAVGTSFAAGAVTQTLIERWDGISWAIVNSPSTNAAEHNQFYGVTCPSALDCWAVGFYKNSLTGNNQTLMERWDGNSWALVPSPNTLSIQDNHLFAVTC